MLSLGWRLPLAFQLWPSRAFLSASGGGWASPQSTSSPLEFAQSFVLWASQQCLRLELLREKFSLSFSVCPPPPLPAISQFGLLSHVSSLRFCSGYSGLVLTLRNAALASLFRPHLLVANATVWATSLLGVAVRRITCGFCLFACFFPPGYVALWESKTPYRPTSERVSWCFETSPPSGLPPTGQVSIPNSFVFLSFIFCPSSFRRQWAVFPGAWCPLPVFRCCFVKFPQLSNDLLMNLWQRKWSPHPIPLPS